MYSFDWFLYAKKKDSKITSPIFFLEYVTKKTFICKISIYIDTNREKDRIYSKRLIITMLKTFSDQWIFLGVDFSMVNYVGEVPVWILSFHFGRKR